MQRSLKVSNGWLKKVKQALSKFDFTSQKALAEELQISTGKTSNFFNGKPVDYETFIAICDRLKLDWQKVAKVSPEVLKTIENPNQGIPRLASSLFHGFEYQAAKPQKKFIIASSPAITPEPEITEAPAITPEPEITKV